MQLTKTDIMRALETETRIMARQRLLKQLWKLGESPNQKEPKKVRQTVSDAVR
jgi:hypothetical protein